MEILLPLLAWTALATPTFVVEQGPEELAEQAGAAWEAAVVCAGYEARAAPEVMLEATTLADSGFTSHAWLGGAGLVRIDLSAVTDRLTLFHEVGHAWTHDGRALPVLSEGRAEFLANCVAGSLVLSDVRERRTVQSPVRLPPLIEWSPHSAIEKDHEG